MANKLFRAIGRVLGVTDKPLEHGEEVTLDHDHEHTQALVKAGALKLASAEETDDEHAGDLGYSTMGSEKGTTLGDAVSEAKPKAKAAPKQKKTAAKKGK